MNTIDRLESQLAIGPRLLHESRRAAADAAFRDYLFEDLAVLEVDGWQYSEPGLEYTRVVYLENVEIPGRDSIRARFTVVFEALDSTAIRQAYAMIGDNQFGHPATDPPAPSIG
jgi:hypothetical protein